jgi:uncharacterized membrane protein
METEILLRWIHFLSGIMWIGLLYYFNFVQVPGMAAGAADTGGPGPAGISKYIAPRALWWFRWGAVVTWLSGAALLIHLPYFGGFLNVMSLGYAGDMQTPQIIAFGIGAWLGTFMRINVWGPIWQNQKKILGLKAATPEEIARAKRVAFLASRSNVVMSIALLLFMGSMHGLLF